MKHLSRISILALAALLFAWSAHAQPVDLGPYYNLVEGRQILYLNLEYDGVSLVPDDTVVQVVTPLASGLTGVLDYHSTSWDLEDLALWQEEADGHYFAGNVKVDTGEIEIHYPPVGPIGGLMEVGVPVVDEAWIIKDGVLDHQERYELSLLATGASCQTAAGTFDDCAVLLLEIFVSDTLVEQQYLIWARDVGEILAFFLTKTAGPSLELTSVLVAVDILNLP